MDYQDKLAGLDHNYFTNKAKLSLLEMLVRKTKPTSEISILSIGCGDGHELEILRKYGRVDVLDVEKCAIDLIPKDSYCTAYIQDLCDFHTTKKYDIIVGLDVLEHIRDDTVAIDRVHESLKEDGYFIFTVPAHQSLFSAHDKALKHFRRYSKRGLEMLVDGNFELVFLSYRYFFLFLPVAANKLINRSSEPRIEAPKLPKLINYIMYLLCRVEVSTMALGIRLPFGISLVGICKG